MRFLTYIFLFFSLSSFADIRLVTSSRPIYDLLNDIKLDQLHLSLIAQKGNSHHKELLPQDKKAIYEGDVILAIEPFDHSLVEAALQFDKKILIVNDLSDHILPLRSISSSHDEHDEGDHEENRYIKDDPHLWLSPLVMQDMIKAIADRYPQMIDDQKYQKFIEYITDYNEKGKTLTAPSWLVYHDAWQYLEHFLGFTQPAFFTQNPESVIRPKNYQTVQQKLKDENIQCILTEPVISKQALRKLKKTTDAKIIQIDPTGRLAPAGENSLYWIWMQYFDAAQQCSNIS